MWELGHSFEEIDALPITDAGDIVAYWTGKARGEEKVRQTERKLGRKYSARGG